MTKKPTARPRKKTTATNCTIPPPIPPKALPELVLPRSEHDVQKIIDYVEWQAKGEKVLHAEKVSVEAVFGRKHECWDVRTNKVRYWVITEPTNLYLQKLFPSLDYTLSFHIGVTARVMAQHEPGVNVLEEMTQQDAWRRWQQAGEVLDNADEFEDFQAVGMRCRECLIVMVRTLALPEMVPEGEASLKKADVVHWCEIIADHVARGSSAKEVRSYLKSTSKAGWELVNWLTHAQNATRADAILAHQMTEHILATFGTAVFSLSPGQILRRLSELWFVQGPVVWAHEARKVPFVLVAKPAVGASREQTANMQNQNFCCFRA